MRTNLKQRLQALKISQAELGRRCGVDPSTVNRWVRGATEVPGSVNYALDLLEKLERIKEMLK